MTHGLVVLKARSGKIYFWFVWSRFHTAAATTASPTATLTAVTTTANVAAAIAVVAIITPTATIAATTKNAAVTQINNTESLIITATIYATIT